LHLTKTTTKMKTGNIKSKYKIHLYKWYTVNNTKITLVY